MKIEVAVVMAIRDPKMYEALGRRLVTAAHRKEDLRDEFFDIEGYAHEIVAAAIRYLGVESTPELVEHDDLRVPAACSGLWSTPSAQRVQPFDRELGTVPPSACPRPCGRHGTTSLHRSSAGYG